MKLKYTLIFMTLLLIMGCEKQEEVVVGGITERSPEEQIQANIQLAPEFAFHSIDGKQVALDELRGKIVYVDIWATWCRPCIMQIPALKEVEEMYKDEDIQFVSISVDKEKDIQKWRNMVREKQLGGLQLYAGSDMKFHNEYKISTIPRFLLIGKEGELISSDAPRPLNHRTNGVNEELLEVFDQLIKEQ